jgi:hypothetical protein
MEETGYGERESSLLEVAEDDVTMLLKVAREGCLVRSSGNQEMFSSPFVSDNVTKEGWHGSPEHAMLLNGARGVVGGGCVDVFANVLSHRHQRVLDGLLCNIKV